MIEQHRTVRLPVSDLRSDISDVANRVAYAKERVVLMRHGRGICALISLDDLARLENLDAIPVWDGR